jgi:hypothetical protein
MSPDASGLDGKPNGPAGSTPNSSARNAAFAPLPAQALLVYLALAAPVAQPLPWMAPQWGALFGAPAARAVELRGSTYFTRPPWKVKLLSYRTTVGERRASYYFTIELSPEAGAPLGRLSIQQTRGADWDFPFWVEQTRAFLGVPRRERQAVPVEAVFDPGATALHDRIPRAGGAWRDGDGGAEALAQPHAGRYLSVCGHRLARGPRSGGQPGGFRHPADLQPPHLVKLPWVQIPGWNGIISPWRTSRSCVCCCQDPGEGYKKPMLRKDPAPASGAGGRAPACAAPAPATPGSEPVVAGAPPH